MKGNSYIKKIILSLMCLLAIGDSVLGQAQIDYSTQREAMVGPGFIINRLGENVSLLKSYENLDAVVDEDIDNYASISGVSLNVGLGPILSVRNTRKVYEASAANPISAGFCIASSDVAGLLGLDLLKMATITFYNKGEIVDTKTVSQQTGSGLDLGLIKLPSSDLVSMELSAEIDKPFDEILLSFGGVELSAITTFCVKYAFVGTAKEYPLTTTGLTEIADVMDLEGISFDYGDCASMPWTPLSLTDLKNKILDDDLENKLSTGGIAIGEWCHIQIGVNKVFEAGTEVGFKYSSVGLLNLSLGAFTTIKLYKDGKEVQSETVEASVLGLGVATASGETKTSIIAKVPFDAARLTIGAGVLAVDLGEAAGIYYGFIKKKPIVNHHCEINSSLSATLCNGETTYRLVSDLPVTWTLESPKIGDDKPDGGTFSQEDLPVLSLATTRSEGVKGNAIDVTNIIVSNFDYKFKATAEDGCFEIITLHKGATGSTTATTCGQPVSNQNGENKYAISDELHESSGSLLSISDMKNAETVVDASTNNYATYVGGLSVANDLGLIGLKTVDGTPFDLVDVDKPRRIGFIVENTSTFLNADVLQFFQIRLYRNGVRLEGSNIPKVIDESNVVGVGLIGTEKSQKVRYSMEVPAGVEFDEFQLWKSGVLDLGLGSLRIYYGFIEDADENCSDPLKSGCAEAVSTTADDNMQVTVTPYMPFSLASVAVVLKDISYLVDDDYETAMQVVQTVDAASEIAFSVKLGRTIDDRHQLGVVMDNIAYLAGVNALSALSIETYKNGSSTGEKFENWTTVGLDVIGYGDKNYLVMNPQSPYDEIRFTIGGLASALNGLNFYGLFFRSDIDGDGLPDCIDTTPCPGELTDIAVTEDICKGDYVHLTGMCTLDAGETEDAYDVYLKYPDNSKEEPLGSLTFTEKDLLIDVYYKIDAEPGQGYKLVLKRNATGEAYKEYEVTFDVHPLETTWKNNNTSTDWNAWDNWSAGSPWTCTDVIIPTGAQVYPLLESGVLNGCHYIHFEPNTEVVNTHYLTYTKAWVEMALNPNRYYMVSVPLKSVYSGDWFLPKVELTSEKTVTQENINSSFTVPYFTDLNETTLPANRVQPTVFQRVWEKTVLNRLPDTGQAPVYPTYESTNWTAPYNWLATPYDKADGYDFNALSVWVHPFRADFTDDDPSVRKDLSYKFRFPKEHTQYFYYDEEGNIRSESARLTRKNVGRFIYEQDDQTAKFPITMRYKNEGFGEDHQVFLAGNPFMTHINVAKLFEGNGHIWSIKVYDGNTYISVIKEEDGTLSSLEEYASIAPMQSFFVEISSEDEENDECAITYTEDMLESKPGTDLLRSVRGAAGGNLLRLTASAAGKEAGALLRFSASASDYYRDGEDADLLIDDEVPPVVALFTLAGERAVDIQQRANGGEIPLGFFLAKPEEMTLRLDVPEQCAGWTLTDAANGKAYPLEAGLNEIELGRMTTNIGRFALRGDLPTGNRVITASQPRIYCYREEGGTLVVRSVEGLMTQCEVYTVAGQLLGMARHETNEYRLPVASGAKIIRVTFADGISSTIKTF